MDTEHENVEVESCSYDDEDSDIDVENVNDSESDAETLRQVDEGDDGDDEDDDDDDDDGNQNSRSGCHNAMERMRREKLTALFKAVENKLVQMNKLKPASCSAKDKDGKKSKDATLEATAATLLENHDTLARLKDIELITDKLFNEYFERPHAATSRKRSIEALGSSLLEPTPTCDVSTSSSASSKRQRKSKT